MNVALLAAPRGHRQVDRLQASGGRTRAVAVADLDAHATGTVAATSGEEGRITKQGVLMEWIADSRIE